MAASARILFCRLDLDLDGVEVEQGSILHRWPVDRRGGQFAIQLLD
jgi:hypothetical protein